MPAVAMFYQLKTKGLDETLFNLLTRARGQGWRVMIRSADPGLTEYLDMKLWTDPADSFVPHGIEGGPHDADQPILLGAGPITNKARALFLLAGAQAEQTEVAGLERIWVLFNDTNPAVQTARTEWTRLISWGLAAQYWSDETDAWVKKTEKPARPG